jgi:hypothetical protein
MSTNEYRKLRKEWYAKLKAEGFKDLESDADSVWESRLLRGKTAGHLKYRIKTATSAYYYYHAIQNFLTHNPYWPYKASIMWHRWLLERHAEGASIRDLVRAYQSGLLITPGQKLHIPTAHAIIKKYLPLIAQWNKESAEGLAFESLGDEE